MTGWREAYGARAREYADFIGRLDLTDDRAWIDRWAGSITGPVLDLGCGPGHWTAHLTASGHDVSGIDPVLRDAPRPAGSLTLGFFDGEHGAAFDHAVATAYTWSLDRLVAELEEVGWNGARPGAAIRARRATARGTGRDQEPGHRGPPTSPVRIGPPAPILPR